MAGVPTSPGDDGSELIEAVRPLVDRIGGRLIDPADVTAGDVALAWRGVVVAAVRLLEEAGAFSYRKSVETVATALGVSRFTVYNYLNRDRP